MPTLALLIVLFLSLSGIMAAIDAAILSVTRPEIEELLIKGRRGAKSLKLLKQELTRAVVVIVMLTNTINVLGPILVARHTVESIGAASLGWVAIVLALGSIICSEIVPKAIGTHYAPTISRFSAAPIRSIQIVLYPIVVALEWLSALFTSGTRKIGTEEQIRSLTTIGRSAGYIKANEGRLIHQAFVLNDRTAADIMTPLPKMVTVDASQSMFEATQVARATVYSRFPVTNGSLDDVIGIVMIRDLLEACEDGRHLDPVSELVRPAFFVGTSMLSDELLLAFRRRQTHLAIVREHRHTVGVVTLEDVLEELVGKIEDEQGTKTTERG